MPVVDEQGLLCGIITNRDVRFVTDLSLTVADVMTPKDQLITVLEGASRQRLWHCATASDRKSIGG